MATEQSLSSLTYVCLGIVVTAAGSLFPSVSTMTGFVLADRAPGALVSSDTLVLKLVLTPGIIAAASLAGRRWGQTVGGWLVGLPLTSGPVAFFLALDHGAGFAAAAAFGSLAGAIAEAAFCLAYGWSAPRGWPPALAAACLAFATVAAALQRVTLGMLALAPLVVVALALALRGMPSASAARPSDAPPRWDIPARMMITTVLVVALTEAAPLLGARLSGVLATFPLYAAILTVFAHRAGPTAAVQVLRGLLVGLLSFAGFFIALGVLIERLGVAGGFVTATAAALVIQAVSFALVRTPA